MAQNFASDSMDDASTSLSASGVRRPVRRLPFYCAVSTPCASQGTSLRERAGMTLDERPLLAVPSPSRLDRGGPIICAAARRNDRRLVGRQHLKIAGALVVVTAAAAGCGSGAGGTLSAQQRAQRVRDYAYLPSTHVECTRVTCRVAATTRLHSEREAFLIAWPLIFGTVKDPGLAPLQTVALKLSDRRSGATLFLNCNRNRASQIPDGVTSVAAVQKHCAWSWRASY